MDAEGQSSGSRDPSASAGPHCGPRWKQYDKGYEAGEDEYGRPENPAASAARAVPVFLAEIKSYLAYFISAKKDATLASVKKVAILAVLGIVAGIVLTILG